MRRTEHLRSIGYEKSRRAFWRGKPFLLAIFAIVLALFTLSGCHGSVKRASFEVPEEFDETRTYEISFWAKNDTNKTQVEIYEGAIASFQEIYPNIHVTLKLYTNYGDIYNDVITNLATDTTPNVCISYPDHIATYLEGQNVVVPLDDLFTDEKYGLGGSEVRFDGPTQAELVPEFLSECDFSGFYYAVPYMRSTESCYVNKTFVEKLGFTLPDVLTWDFVWEVSEAAMEKDANGNYLVNGQKILYPFMYKSTDNMMIQRLSQMEAPYSSGRGEVLLFNDTTKSVLYEISEHAFSRSFTTFSITGYPANFLNAGQCIFAVDSTAGSTWMGSDAPLVDIPKDKLVQFETAVMTVPQVDPENPKMISQGPSICLFNKADHQEVLASWLFLQYMLTNDVQISYATTEGYVPVTLKAKNSPEYQDYLSRSGEDNSYYYPVKIAATKLLIDNMANTFVTPVFSGSASLRDAAGYLIEDVTKARRRKKEVDDAYVENLYKETASLYHLDEIVVKDEELTSDRKAVLGELPGEAKTLIGILIVVWIGILLYVVTDFVREQRKKKAA